jgi:hypothetical protein
MPKNKTIPEKFKFNDMYLKFQETDRKIINVWGASIDSFVLSLSYIKTQHKKIYDHITIKYENKNTLKGHLRVLYNLLKMTGETHFSYIYETLYFKISKELQIETRNNLMSEKQKEHFIKFDKLLELRKKYEELLKTSQSNKNNIYHLILSLSTLQAPLRADIFNMLVESKAPADIPEDENNYITKNDNIYYYVINRDKNTSESKKRAIKKKIEYIRPVIELDTPLIKKIHGIPNIDITTILNESLLLFPRKYLIPLLDDGEKALNSNSARHLKAITGHNYGTSLIRDAYVNHYMRLRGKDELNTNELFNIASHMRHSNSTAQANYKKQEIELDQLGGNAKIKTAKKPNSKIIDKKTFYEKYRKTDEQKANMKKAYTKWYEKDKDKNKLKGRIRKVLYDANIHKTTPSNKSITEYMLSKDKNGIWNSSKII